MARIPQYHLAILVFAMILQALMFPGNLAVTAEDYNTALTPPAIEGNLLDQAAAVASYVQSVAQVVVSFPVTLLQLATLSPVPGMPTVFQAAFTVYTIGIIGPAAVGLATDIVDALGNLIPFT